MNFFNVLIAAGMLCAAAGLQAQNLVTNGSFESTTTANVPGQAPGTWDVYTSIVGWTGMPNIEVRNNVSGVAQDGHNFVELDTHPTSYSSSTNSTMYQDILGTGTVNLSFYFSARPGTGATNDLGFSFGSYTDNHLLAGTSNNSSSHNWMQYTLNNFQLNASGTTRLSFYALGTADTYGGSLDNVVITSVTAVPEPETYALLLAGLGLMGAAVRRQKRQA